MMFMEHIDDGYIQVEVRCYVLYQLERYMIYLLEVFCSQAGPTVASVKEDRRSSQNNVSRN